MGIWANTVPLPPVLPDYRGSFWCSRLSGLGYKAMSNSFLGVMSYCGVCLSLRQVSDFMLSMESAELNVTFFAAQTIHAKIQNNFRELPQERCVPPVYPL